MTSTELCDIIKAAGESGVSMLIVSDTGINIEYNKKLDTPSDDYDNEVCYPNTKQEDIIVDNETTGEDDYINTVLFDDPDEWDRQQRKAAGLDE